MLRYTGQGLAHLELSAGSLSPSSLSPMTRAVIITVVLLFIAVISLVVIFILTRRKREREFEKLFDDKMLKIDQGNDKEMEELEGGKGEEQLEA